MRWDVIIFFISFVSFVPPGHHHTHNPHPTKKNLLPFLQSHITHSKNSFLSPSKKEVGGWYFGDVKFSFDFRILVLFKFIFLLVGFFLSVVCVYDYLNWCRFFFLSVCVCDVVVLNDVIVFLVVLDILGIKCIFVFGYDVGIQRIFIIPCRH